MRPFFLAAAIAAALASGTAPAHAAGTLDVRYLRLSELSSVLASTAGQPSAWTTPPTLSGKILAELADDPDPIIAWVAGASLEAADSRMEALDILEQGVPVLLTVHPGDTRYESGVFGVTAKESTLLYQPLADGTLHMHIFDDTSDPAMLGRIGGRVADEVASRVQEAHATRDARRSRQRRDVAGTSSPTPEGVPTKSWSASHVGANGSRMAIRVTVTRNASATGDSKIITVKSDAEAIPYDNGFKTLYQEGTVLFIPYSISTKRLFIPRAYTQHTLLRWNEANDPKVSLLTHHPLTDGATDRVISDKHSTKTSWGAGVSPDVSRSLADGKITTAGKIPLSFSYGREYVDEQTVQMTLKDYGVGFREKRGAGYAAAIWDFPLATDIAANRKHFNDGYGLTDARMTPMMHRANLQSIATWRVRGDYEGKLTVDSVASVQNRWYTRKNVSLATLNDDAVTRDVDDCDNDAAVDNNRGCKLIGLSTTGSVRDFVTNTTQPLASIELDLSSPFLTRSPTVLLQSLKYPNQCLAKLANYVVLTECDRSEGNRYNQWMLDEFGRYVNRSSGSCMQLLPSFNDIGLRPCTQSLLQQWEWRADRIHSRFEGGRRQLRAPDDQSPFRSTSPTAGYRPDIDVVLPINPTNALLPPWATYPLKPHKGDFVPGFNFTAAPLPESYLQFGDVDDALRWTTVPLVVGIK